MATDTTRPAPPELWPAGTWTTSPRVTMNTTLGSVVLELAPNDAQYTVVNFLAYVNSGFYTNLIFHRVIAGFVAQGGGFTTSLTEKTPFYLPIPYESDSGLKNIRGTISMARTSDPNSATSQFFFNLVNNSDLDFKSHNDPGYTVFGKIVSGLTVMDAIGKVATGIRGSMEDVPLKNIVINSTVETTTGTIHNKTGVVLVGGTEFGATWEYSVDKGAHWKAGSSSGANAFKIKLAEGPYEENDILIRSADKAGNVSKLGHTGASVVMFAGAAILGNAEANVLKGTSGNDHIYGLAGKDTLNGNAGKDYLDGGSGIDTMNGGTGNDTYIVRQAHDIVKETSTGGVDLVQSFATAHTLASFVENGQIMSTTAASLTGNGLDNTLFAGLGNNVLNGGAGNDTVSYAFGTSGTHGVTVTLASTLAQSTRGSGTETLISVENLTGTAFNDNLTGNDTTNVLRGAAGNDILRGAGGADSLFGDAGADTLEGGSGDDRMVGGAGIDTLRGGAGHDTMFGGTGNDKFDFDSINDLGNTAVDTDTIRDFAASDILDLSGIDADSTTALVNDGFDTTLVTVFTAPGQLKFDDGVLSGNTDLDFNTVEFVINLTGVTSLSPANIIV